MNRKEQYRLSDLTDLKPELDRARDEYYELLNCLDECRQAGYSITDLNLLEVDLNSAKEKYLELKGQYEEIETN